MDAAGAATCEQIDLETDTAGNFVESVSTSVLTGLTGGAAAAEGVDISLGYVLGGAWGAGSQDGAGAATIATMETSRTSFTQKPETSEADSPIGFMFAGLAPYMAAYFRFDYQGSPDLYLDPRTEEAVKLDIFTRNSASAADGTNRVILDRYVLP